MEASLLSNYPELIAVGIALLGFVAASFTVRLVEFLLNVIERGIRRLSPLRAEQLTFADQRTLIQRLVYYLTLSFFLLLALRILGISALSDWLDLLIGYIPQVIIAGVIILGGYVLGVLAHSFVSNLIAPNEDLLLPRLAQTLVMVAAVMTGLAQMSINVSFLANVIVILLGTLFGGLSLAFALGSRQLVANLLSRRDVSRYEIGDRIRVDDQEGTIIEFVPTGVVLQAEEGIVTIPAIKFAEKPVLRLKRNG